jgi:tRNA(fMet)-specific endonuclease VapC
VACELRFGARKKNAPMLTARIERLLQTIEILPLDGEVDRTYAEVRAALEIVGRPIGANDLLIAAHAIFEDCVLVTNNVSEFEQVNGLLVENWLAA